MIRKLSYGSGVVLAVAAAWWLADGVHNPCYYVVMTIVYGLLLWLVGVFAWHWGKKVARYIVQQAMCMLGIAHRSPEPHLPSWEDRPVKVRRYGPIKDHWWSQGYYASVEYVVCRHRGCRAFKITRIFKDL